jgi:hypothetical protein
MHHPRSDREPAATVRLAELLASLSLAMDLGLGQPLEHVLRSCLIALRLGEASGAGTGDLQELEAIAKVDHVAGRGWYGLRRIAADTAESATTDDRVKDRLGGWQDSETRKQIYQDRQTDELRTEASKVRRGLRHGVQAPTNGAKPSVDLDALLAALTPEQQSVLAARINAPMGPRTGPRKKSPGPVGIPATASDWNYKTSKERATGLEPATSSLGSWHSTN